MPRIQWLNVTLPNLCVAVEGFDCSVHEETRREELEASSLLFHFFFISISNISALRIGELNQPLQFMEGLPGINGLIAQLHPFIKILCPSGYHKDGRCI